MDEFLSSKEDVAGSSPAWDIFSHIAILVR